MLEDVVVITRLLVFGDWSSMGIILEDKASSKIWSLLCSPRGHQANPHMPRASGISKRERVERAIGGSAFTLVVLVCSTD